MAWPEKENDVAAPVVAWLRECDRSEPSARSRHSTYMTRTEAVKAYKRGELSMEDLRAAIKSTRPCFADPAERDSEFVRRGARRLLRDLLRGVQAAR